MTLRTALSTTVALTALTLAGLPGCGDDDPDTTADTSVADTATDTSAGGDTTADTTATTSPTDAATTEDTAADTSQDTAVNPIAACNYTFAPTASYITKLRLANMTEDPADDCCFEYTGDAEKDNKIGEIVKLIVELPQIENNPNDIIAQNIADGRFTILLEWRGLDSVQTDPESALHLFYGADADGDANNNAAGTGSFYTNLSSFAPDTANANTSFDNVLVVNGNVTGGPTTFRLVVPLVNGLVIDVDIQEARIDGVVTAGPNGSGPAMSGTLQDAQGAILGARLGGYIHQDQLFGALNNFVSASCGCLDTGVDGQGNARAALERDANGAWSCNDDVDSSGCSDADPAESQCITLANVCGLALVIIAPDIDSDEDGKLDSLSIGAWFEATSATLLGPSPAECGE